MIADTTTAISDRSALAAQARQTAGGHEEVMLTWRAEVATLVAALVNVMVPEGDEEDEEMSLWLIATTARSQAI